MPVHANWADDHRTILRLSFDGKWEQAELMEKMDTIAGFVDAALMPVSFILDFADNHYFPPEFMTYFPRIAHARMLNHPNVRHVVVVGAEGVNEVFLKHFSEVYHALEFAPTYDEAYDLIRQGGADEL